MKRIATLFAAVMMFSGCAVLSSINWDPNAISSAASKVLTAASISDVQIVQLCQQSMAQLDAQAVIDNGAYQQRLNRLFGRVKAVGNLPVNFKVYKTKEINAFASGDGSVRVYSGLMDAMTDEELVAIVGHELGHLVHQDTKNAMKKAYLASAAVDAVGAAGSLGAITASTLGNITESFLNAQFSQKQEYAADEYGFQFAIDCGQSPYSMYKALNKLLTLSGGSSAASSNLSQKFASHPKTSERAARMLAAAEAYKK